MSGLPAATLTDAERPANLLDRLRAVETISLESGAHNTFAEGACVMEMLAWVAREQHSDHPQCACPVIAAFLRTWNDGLRSDAERDRLLKPLIPRLLDSRSTGSCAYTRLRFCA